MSASVSQFVLQYIQLAIYDAVHWVGFSPVQSYNYYHTRHKHLSYLASSPPSNPLLRCSLLHPSRWRTGTAAAQCDSPSITLIPSVLFALSPNHRPDEPLSALPRC